MAQDDMAQDDMAQDDMAQDDMAQDDMPQDDNDLNQDFHVRTILPMWALASNRACASAARSKG
jgi:hypothetical protein